jgi:hypothetical protein
MWVCYFFISYLILALTIPASIALVPAWRKRRGSQPVTCPVTGASSVVVLDPWYAARMRALGNYELRVRSCTCWPERCDCTQECLAQIEAVAGNNNA